MSHTTTDIRNICLAGHAGSGKTSLLEALLNHGGVINSIGSVEARTTVSDFDEEEKRLGHSLEPTVCSFTHTGIHLNVIDTPGYPDFVGRAFGVFPAVETVAVVINASTGIEPVTERVLEQAADYNLCRLIIVNRIDAPDANPGAVLDAIRERVGSECLPLNLPVDGAAAVKDCFFEPWEGDSDIGGFAEAHDRIVDQVVEVDDELMELYIEQGEELTPDQLHAPFERALREGHLIPVCFTSARTEAGMDELLEVFERLMPNPNEGNPPQFLRGEGESAEPVEITTATDAHVLAHVFKITVDPFRGRMGFCRIHQGTIKRQAQVYIGDGRKPFKVAHLLRVRGADQEEVDEVVPGDICAIPRAEGFFFDAVLHDSHDEDHYHLKSVSMPPQMYQLAISSLNDAESQKVSDALHTLQAEDPSITVEHRANLNETVISGLGDLHLQAVLARMSSLYHVDVETRTPSIAYRETITGKAEGHSRHKKQTGGAGQFGEVFLRIEPLPRGDGFEFADEVVGGAIPHQLIPAVEKGVRQVLDSGAIAGFPLQDVKVTVYDGKHHSVDSKEIAFVAAGRKAFTEAINQAKPVVLEPVVNVEVIAPDHCMGAISGDLSGMRGMINGTESLSGGHIRINAQAPLAEIITYHSRLKSITGGEGSFTLAPDHYAQVPKDVQAHLSAQFDGTAEDD